MSVDFLSKNFPPFQVHHAKKPPRFYPDGFQRNVIDFYFIFSDCRLRKALYLQFSYFIWPLRAYINKTRRYNALCVDIEGLVTDYLGLTVVYETIVEDDLNKIAFLSNGKRPLRVVRDGKRVEVIFPKNTVVLDKVLLNEKESSRRRFTLGHEGAHSIIAKQNPMQDVGCFHNTFDPERQYTLEERRELLSFSEAQADRLSSVFLMPRFILEKVMKKYKCENGIPVYGWNVFAPEDKITLRKMADCMGVSHQALVIRLKTLKLLIPHDLTEYLEKGLQLGGAQ